MCDCIFIVGNELITQCADGCFAFSIELDQHFAKESLFVEVVYTPDSLWLAPVARTLCDRYRICDFLAKNEPITQCASGSFTFLDRVGQITQCVDRCFAVSQSDWANHTMCEWVLLIAHCVIVFFSSEMN